MPLRACPSRPLPKSRGGRPQGCGPHLLPPSGSVGARHERGTLASTPSCSPAQGAGAPSTPPCPRLLHLSSAWTSGHNGRARGMAGSRRRPRGPRACGSGLGHQSLRRWPFLGLGGAHSAAFPGAWPLAGCSGPDLWPRGGTEGPTGDRGDVEQTRPTEPSPARARLPSRLFGSRMLPFMALRLLDFVPKAGFSPRPALVYSANMFCWLSATWRWGTLCPPPGHPGALPTRAHAAFTEHAGCEPFEPHPSHHGAPHPWLWPPPGPRTAPESGYAPGRPADLTPGWAGSTEGSGLGNPSARPGARAAQMLAKGEAPRVLGTVGQRGWEGLSQRPSEAEPAAGYRAWTDAGPRGAQPWPLCAPRALSCGRVRHRTGIH